MRPLITQPISDRQRVTIEGNTRPEARNPEYDRGPVADDFAIPHMWLELKRSPEQEKALELLIDAMHKPGSPYFHKWLTAAEFGATFGVGHEDIATISSWLESQGLHVDGVFTNQMVIEFSGNAGQVREAFHTEIHALEVRGETHFANTSDPQIPAALAPAVAGVVSLNDFQPHGRPVRADRTVIDPATGVETQERIPAKDEGGDHASPEYTFSSQHDLVPADAQTIYNITPIYTAGFTGKGQTIALLQDSDAYSAADFTTYRAKFGLNTAYPSGNLQTIHPHGTASCTDPGATVNDDEVELDMEMATAVAPNATVELATCKGGANFGGLIALQNLINSTSYPPVISMSYGVCEAVSGATANLAFSNAFQQATAQGVSVFVSSGDNAGAQCEEALDPNTQGYATHGLNVTGWGESAYNVSVGGTDFEDSYLKTTSTYWGSTNADELRLGEVLYPGDAVGQLLCAESDVDVRGIILRGCILQYDGRTEISGYGRRQRRRELLFFRSACGGGSRNRRHLFRAGEAQLADRGGGHSARRQARCAGRLTLCSQRRLGPCVADLLF